MKNKSKSKRQDKAEKEQKDQSLQMKDSIIDSMTPSGSILSFNQDANTSQKSKLPI